MLARKLGGRDQYRPNIKVDHKQQENVREWNRFNQRALKGAVVDTFYSTARKFLYQL